MTAVENVSPFMTQDRNPSPITESQVAKKSTAKASKYLNNLSQRSNDSQTSSSQNSGPLFVEDDSLETDDLNGSSDMIINGNGRMSDGVEDDELLLDESKEESINKKRPADFDSVENDSKLPKLDSNHVDSLASASPKMGQNDLDIPEESSLSSLEAPEENTLSSDPAKEQGNSGKASPTEEDQSQHDDKVSKNHSDKTNSVDNINDNGLDAKSTPLFSDDSNSNSNSVSSRVNKLLGSGSDSDKTKLRVSDTFKGSLKAIVRRVSVQSESDKDSACSSPKSVGKGNLFENMGLVDESSQESAGDPKTSDSKTKGEGVSDEPAPKTDQENGDLVKDDVADRVKDDVADSINEDCDKECENRLLSTSKSDGNLDSDVDEAILDDPEPDIKPKKETLNETDETDNTKEDVETKDVKDLKDIKIDIENKVKEEGGVSKTDDVIKQDTEIADDTKDNITAETVKDKTPKAGGKSEEKPVNGGVKRSLSPADAPNAAPKRSKLEEMIGRLSSSVGKKPEEVENMDEVESESSSESDGSSESGKQNTITAKDLNRIIRKRMDIILKNEKAKMQKKIEELQTEVEAWRTQAKELQKQVIELSTKSPRSERRRQSLKVSTRNFTQQVDESKVQAAQYQQGLNTGTKSAPRTPTTPTGSTPGRTLLNNSTGQNAITVRNAQMRPIAPHPGKDTVRTLLENQRGVVGGIATAGTAPRNVRPSLNVKTPAVKQLGGCIDLTDDDDKSPPTKQATAVRTVTQTSQILSPVVQTPALRGNAVLLQSSPGGPLVLQPVTQGMRLAQQANVVYASGPGGSLVRPGVTMAGQVPHFRAGQILVPAQQRSASSTTTVNRPPPPLKSAPSLQKHPAPLPPTPSSAGTYPKQPPPKPSLKISRVQQGIVLSWNMTLGKGHAEITNYQLFAYQETSAAPSTNLWKKVGDVKALPLPMACTLTQFQEGNKYHFAVRAIDAHNRMGPFSDACSIHLSPAS